MLKKTTHAPYTVIRYNYYYDINEPYTILFDNIEDVFIYIVNLNEVFNNFKTDTIIKIYNTIIKIYNNDNTTISLLLKIILNNSQTIILQENNENLYKDCELYENKNENEKILKQQIIRNVPL
jgi:hypothetical protein